jgi:23S rRNA (uracil1939-C5)-methyltransferase
MEVTAQQLVAGGDALARLPSGKVIFIEGALPNEVVRISLTDTRRDFGRGVVEEIIEASPDRRTPPCKYVAKGCGGCAWQHISPEAQYEAKVRIVAESLARTGKVTSAAASVDNIMRFGVVNPVGSRTTVRIAFDADGKPGFRARASHDVVAVDTCLVAHPLVNEVLSHISAVPGSDAEVTLRCSVSTGVVGLLVHGDVDDINGLDAADIAGDEARLSEHIGDADLAVSMGAFFQSSPQGAELLVNAVRALAGPEALTGSLGAIVDAYGGGGLLSASLVPSHVPVILIEENEFAIDDAKVNLRGRNAKIVPAPVEDWRPSPAGLVIADPARSGMGANGVKALVASGAPRFILVSCDPAAGSRDVRLLCEAGYQVDAVGVLDLFPHTNHLEMITSLSLVTSAVAQLDDEEPFEDDVPPAA